uniref:Rieske domain-containing protein n=1 Tax=Chromera velia CCMP2878 TaxID=1169474 RepID=A0A0G4HI12_9ALVE|eukprot:Cvel_27765.t1-p1 / transcript=Cvel_27765.t1 / gene=Cvel_27765 / organism=Chromera_velia_CCMP2878 / gene_product=Chlorophyllide a oxygenase, chloroplastic, putative / transcript_product=Chlorophyllide a oxygenase, chloroplastic, putative / location=Cvel_scaffold3519:7997-11514(-) / protein_length=531 / sequence_SO=supercontig / SO=protein_coding / is_pseudo=false
MASLSGAASKKFLRHVDTDLRSYWYPLALGEDVTDKKPSAVRILGEPVIIFRDADGEVRCLHDRCCHKNVRLSTARIVDGKVECFYHGWQFDGSGACVKIPSLPKGGSIPSNACVKSFPCVEQNGLVWVWPGPPEKADLSKVPDEPVFHDKKMHRRGVCVDLPVDSALWTENLMDLAHTPFAHDGAFNSRKDAEPMKLSYKAIEGGLEGFLEYGGKTLGKDVDMLTRWRAPCVSEVIVTRKDIDWKLHMFFYNVPTAPGQTRHIFVSFRNWGWILNLIPTMAKELDLHVVQQDMEALMAQQRNMIEGAPVISTPIQCDEMALAFRRWHRRAYGVSVGVDRDSGRVWRMTGGTCSIGNTGGKQEREAEKEKGGVSRKGSELPSEDATSADENSERGGDTSGPLLTTKGSGEEEDIESAWWRGWDGALPVDVLAQSAFETSFGHRHGGAFERAVTRTAGNKPLVSLWREQRGHAVPHPEGEREGFESDSYMNAIFRGVIKVTDIFGSPAVGAVAVTAAVACGAVAVARSSGKI